MKINILPFAVSFLIAAIIPSAILGRDISENAVDTPIDTPAEHFGSISGRQAIPTDGEMIKLSADNMWKLSYLPAAPLACAEIITTGLKFPSISPDGTRIALLDRNEKHALKKLIQWNDEDKKLTPIMEADEVSGFITWTHDGDLVMREASKPFAYDGLKLRYKIDKKGPKFRSGKRMNEGSIFVYDADDVIILIRRDKKTLQAISDTSADRYYAPILSPDRRFVAFCGLTTGVHVFDLEKNAVVFIGKNGSEPSFSPDGRYLIYSQTKDNGEQFTEGNLVLLDLDQRSFRYISNPNGDIYLRGTISRNAEKIAYETADGKIFRAKLLNR